VTIIALLASLAFAGSKYKRLEDQLDKISDIKELNNLKQLTEEPTDSKRDVRRKKRANRKLSKAKRILRPRK
jgi:hypothetical protein